ncbi:MAG: NTP transferase domain-containing protein [Opitutae bacterium]|nr:NTP transferase domain-containing protein [Opitutae bacterium]
MAPTLLVLAAGMGSRYGGLKQLDPVGPGGETILDYGVFDAVRAGFGRVVFVIRREFETAFREQVTAKYAGRVPVDFVFQALDALPAGLTPPAGREKPWGTGHAVWCARNAIREPFAVVNADDFYGADSYRQLAKFLMTPTAAGAAARFCMVGFRLDNTLSEHGTVSRGVCAADGAGRLLSVTEQTGIAHHEVGAGGKYSGAETVSMNCWGVTPALFPALEAQFREFWARVPAEPKAEFYLPAAVSTMIARGEASVQVLPTANKWFGVTNREDRPRVVAALGELVQRGDYPAKLF